MESILSQQQLTDQLASRDPFQKAQAMYQQQQVAQPSPFNAGIAPQASEPIQQPSALNALYQPEQQNESPDFSTMLKSQGIEAQGLQFNDMGRLQLVSRLSQKYGAQYDSEPLAQQILKAFDQSRQALSQDDRDKLDRNKQAADRTLAFLQGLQP